jgi:hypothetical protein
MREREVLNIIMELFSKITYITLPTVEVKKGCNKIWHSVFRDKITTAASQLNYSMHTKEFFGDLVRQNLYNLHVYLHCLHH